MLICRLAPPGLLPANPAGRARAPRAFPFGVSHDCEHRSSASATYSNTPENKMQGISENLRNAVQDIVATDDSEAQVAIACQGGIVVGARAQLDEVEAVGHVAQGAGKQVASQSAALRPAVEAHEIENDEARAEGLIERCRGNVDDKSQNPARIVGLGKRGLLVPGYEADLVVFGKDFSVLASMVGGRFIKNELA